MVFDCIDSRSLHPHLPRKTQFELNNCLCFGNSRIEGDDLATVVPTKSGSDSDVILVYYC